ncbi:protoporphyrinogen oxidase [Schistocerca gregaria]|uniref:protoporphyrinogen oxidase n=1 Tax=Schistocerca gregaria TaxID=7010 RepID=UPI00211DC8DE|nr:protoporphyrinogen oxidase [Schistocerca gregaria]XP_049838217.1 protoporphyrinogen oxidase [Schistocerca gregaria]
MIGVLGGGISGLAAAHYLLKTKVQPVTVLEASHRIGGWIQTTNSPTGNIYEHGPRTIRVRGPLGENTLLLVKELGLSNKVLPIPSTHPAARNRMVYVDKKLHLLPSNLTSILLPKPPFTKPIISALLKDISTAKKEVSDESIYDFVERRLGKELAEFAISPLICGVCAGDAKKISAKFLMKSLFEAEQKHGSIFKGMMMNMLQNRKNKMPPSQDELCERARKERWNVWSLEGGMEELPKALESNVRQKGCEIVLNAPCTEMHILNDKEVFVKAGSVEHKFNHVFCALPAYKLAELVHRQHPQLSSDLAAIPYVSVGLVNLQYDGKCLKQDAFGFLVPPSQKLPILGIVFDSCCFGKNDKTVLTVMMGGAWFEELFGENPSPDTFLSTAVKYTTDILGIVGKPESHSVSILRNCIPQYVLGHHDRVDRIRKYIKQNNLPISVIGAPYDGVGVNDVIFSSKQAVANMH